MKISWSSLPAHSCRPVASTPPVGRRRPRTAFAPPRTGGLWGRHPRVAPCSMVAREGPRSSVAPLTWWLAVSTPPAHRWCRALAGRRPPRHLRTGGGRKGPHASCSLATGEGPRVPTARSLATGAFRTGDREGLLAAATLHASGRRGWPPCRSDLAPPPHASRRNHGLVAL